MSMTSTLELTRELDDARATQALLGELPVRLRHRIMAPLGTNTTSHAHPHTHIQTDGGTHHSLGFVSGALLSQTNEAWVRLGGPPTGASDGDRKLSIDSLLMQQCGITTDNDSNKESWLGLSDTYVVRCSAHEAQRMLASRIAAVEAELEKRRASEGTLTSSMPFLPSDVLLEAQTARNTQLNASPAISTMGTAPATEINEFRADLDDGCGAGDFLEIREELEEGEDAQAAMAAPVTVDGRRGTILPLKLHPAIRSNLARTLGQGVLADTTESGESAPEARRTDEKRISGTLSERLAVLAAAEERGDRTVLSSTVLESSGQQTHVHLGKEEKVAATMSHAGKQGVRRGDAPPTEAAAADGEDSGGLFGGLRAGFLNSRPAEPAGPATSESKSGDSITLQKQKKHVSFGDGADAQPNQPLPKPPSPAGAFSGRIVERRSSSSAARERISTNRGHLGAVDAAPALSPEPCEDSPPKWVSRFMRERQDLD